MAAFVRAPPAQSALLFQGLEDALHLPLGYANPLGDGRSRHGGVACQQVKDFPIARHRAATFFENRKCARLEKPYAPGKLIPQASRKKLYEGQGMPIYLPFFQSSLVLDRIVYLYRDRRIPRSHELVIHKKAAAAPIAIGERMHALESSMEPGDSPERTRLMQHKVILEEKIVHSQTDLMGRQRCHPRCPDDCRSTTADPRAHSCTSKAQRLWRTRISS